MEPLQTLHATSRVYFDLQNEVRHHTASMPRRQSHSVAGSVSKYTSSSAIAERPRCMLGLLWLKLEDWNSEITFTNIIGLSLTTVT